MEIPRLIYVECCQGQGIDADSTCAVVDGLRQVFPDDLDLVRPGIQIIQMNHTRRYDGRRNLVFAPGRGVRGNQIDADDIFDGKRLVTDFQRSRKTVIINIQSNRIARLNGNVISISEIVAVPAVDADLRVIGIRADIRHQ